MSTLILEVTRYWPATLEESAFFKAYAESGSDEGRVVGHFAEGQVHRSFGFSMSAAALHEATSLVRRVCQTPFEPGRYEMSFRLRRLEVGGAEESESYVIPFGWRQTEEEHKVLLKWVESVFAMGKRQLHA